LPFPPKTRVGPYEIVGALGAGGMGEVFRARDTRLHRDVALKVLPDSFASDADRIARFTREAQALAALNHPHIAQLYGVEEQGATRALVMELVEGETLADRIAGGPVPLDEAVPIARQIADALEAAHEAGIIHRDLKPANIKLRPDGTVKVLDFGLAKPLDDAARAGGTGAGRDPLNSPTITTPAMTQAGVILGTAAYMSPEQARGKPVDKRADIWAFGCVLFEMLAGSPAFGGETVTDVLGAIVRAEPDWGALPSDVPIPVRRLLRRALEKDARERLRDLGDARPDLTVERDDGTAPGGGDPRTFSAREVVAWALAAVATGAAFLVPPWIAQPAPASRRVHFTISPPGGTSFVTPAGRLAVSPDGAKVVFAVRDGDTARLVLHQLSSGSTTTLAGSDGVSGIPFWSPDSEAVAFVADSKLKRVSTATGGVQVICDMPVTLPRNPFVPGPAASASGTWGADGTIVFAVGSSGTGTEHPLFRVPAAGGKPAPLTTLNTELGETEHAFPVFVPDARYLLYGVRRRGGAAAVVLAPIDQPDQRRLLLDGVSRALPMRRHLAFPRGDVLYVQPFDSATGIVSGDPVPVAQQMATTLETARGAFGVSSDGDVIVTERVRPPDPAQFTWLDIRGQVLGTAGAPEAYSPSFDVSADGARAAVVQSGDIWIVDLALGTRQRVTSEPQNDGDPVWSPDGTRVVFTSRRAETPDLFLKWIDRAEPAARLFGTPDQPEWAEDWSPDGRHVAIVRGIDLAVVSLADGKLHMLTDDLFKEDEPQFSPNGKWIAYNSDESGASEIYAMPFPPTGAKWPVSTGGGVQPRWAHDGKALYFLRPDGALMRVRMDAATGRPAAAPERLFHSGLRFVLENSDQYHVAPGDRFLVLKPASVVDRGTLAVLLNGLLPEAK
jgi:eukaryotic-like serine/threonine-protein kinase